MAFLAISAMTMAGCGATNASAVSHPSSPSKQTEVSSSSSSPNGSSASQGATVAACSLISQSQVSTIMSLPIGAGSQQSLYPSGTQCSYQTTTSSLTGGIGSNIVIAARPATQSYAQFKSTMLNEPAFGFQQMEVSGTPVLISKSGAQSATVIGHVQLSLDVINTVSASYDKPEVLAALKICIAKLQNS